MVASTLIAHAAHARGYHVQVFPEFGVERRGVPVTAFARISREPIRVRTKIKNPDHVIVLDPAIARYLPVTDGLRHGGTALMNASSADALASLEGDWRLAWVDATEIAARHGIGTKSAPIVNTAIVGAFAAVTGVIELEEVAGAIRTVLPKKAEENVEAAREAFEGVVVLPSPITSAIEGLYEGGAR